MKSFFTKKKKPIGSFDWIPFLIFILISAISSAKSPSRYDFKSTNCLIDYTSINHFNFTQHLLESHNLEMLESMNKKSRETFFLHPELMYFHLLNTMIYIIRYHKLSKNRKKKEEYLGQFEVLFTELEKLQQTIDSISDTNLALDIKTFMPIILKFRRETSISSKF